MHVMVDLFMSMNICTLVHMGTAHKRTLTCIAHTITSLCIIMLQQSGCGRDH